MLEIIIVVWIISSIFLFGVIIAVEKNWIHIHTWEDESKQICSSNYCPDRDKVREN